MMEPIGRGGHVAGYDVLMCGDAVTVARGGAVVARQTVPNYGTALADLSARPGFALGWARFPDGAEVLFLYDKHDGGFGYALNLADPACSEWGYAPFAPTPRPPSTTKDGPPLVLRPTTPTVRRRTVRIVRRPACRTRGGNLDSECASHLVAPAPVAAAPVPLAS